MVGERDKYVICGEVGGCSRWEIQWSIFILTNYDPMVHIYFHQPYDDVSDDIWRLIM